MTEKIPDLEMTREEKERLVAKVTDVVFEGILNRADAVAILEVCSQACGREAQKVEQEMEKLIGKPCDVIQ